MPDSGRSGSADKVTSQWEIQLTQEKEKLEQTLMDIEDKYKRSLAETENVRMRMKKQAEDAKLFGIQSFCKDLLDVADVLTTATESVPSDELAKNVNPALSSLFEGLKLTEVELLKVFAKHGLVRIEPRVGEKFDPNFHEALFETPLGENSTPGSVAILTKVGYKLRERTLRPAYVGVFKSS